MSTVLSDLLGLGSRSERSARRGATEPPAVLIAGGNSDDQRAMQDLLRGSRWRTVVATEWGEALAVVQGSAIPVVLCDRDLPGAEWQQGIASLHRAGVHPEVILLSSVADPYLWNELVQAGGFDVLARPFHRDEALAMIEFAYTHWRSDHPGRRGQLITPLRTA